MLKFMPTSFNKDLADRQRRSVLALCSATNSSAPMQERLDAAHTALSQFEVGSVYYKNVVRQIPDLAEILEAS